MMVSMWFDSPIPRMEMKFHSPKKNLFNYIFFLKRIYFSKKKKKILHFYLRKMDKEIPLDDSNINPKYVLLPFQFHV